MKIIIERHYNYCGDESLDCNEETANVMMNKDSLVITREGYETLLTPKMIIQSLLREEQ